MFLYDPLPWPGVFFLPCCALTLLESLESEVKGAAKESFSGHTSLLFALASFWGQFPGSKGFTVAVRPANTCSEGQA